MLSKYAYFRVKLCLQSSDFQTFEVANAIISERLKVIDCKEDIIRCTTPKKRCLLVTLIKDENRMELEFQSNKRKTLQEIHEITLTSKQKSLDFYARACQAKDGKDLMEWCLRYPSEEVRLHIWELMKADPRRPIQVENILFEQQY